MPEKNQRDMTRLKRLLEGVYAAYNRRELVDPDPLMFLYRYPDPKQRELVGLIAAFFAYGRVSQILLTVGGILDIMGEKPKEYVMERKRGAMSNDFKGFKYRFTTAEHLENLFSGIKTILSRSPSLYDFFMEGFSPDAPDVLPALTRFMTALRSSGDTGFLTADPSGNSACKRNHLFLRWMVREDAVDPGGWSGIPWSRLVIPLDTHMHRAGTILGFTRRKTGDIRTAMEITEGFRAVCPHDPVRYDFSLTRFGIRREMSMETLEELVCNHVKPMAM